VKKRKTLENLDKMVMRPDNDGWSAVASTRASENGIVAVAAVAAMAADAA
jgi:hypothetical protein